MFLKHTLLCLVLYSQIEWVNCKSPFTNNTLLGVAEDLYFRVLDLQVPKTRHFFPPFSWDEEQGMWPSDVKLNYYGNPDKTIFRDFFGVFDNNMFATTYILSCFLEGRRYLDSYWYRVADERIVAGLDAIKSHHDMNVNFSNSLMTFWPQKYNETLGAYISYPVNLNDLIEMTQYMPLNATYKFLEELGLKDVEDIVKHLMSTRAMYTMAFHIPPDFDDTFLNIGLGSVLQEMKHLFPNFTKIWSSHNTNLNSVFDALKHYAYRPFSGDQRVNTIDPRSYYYLRKWLEQEENAGNDVALVPTWIQDTDEIRTWFDKGVLMPFNVNNIDVTVCANFIFGVTSGIINGLFAPSLLDDPEIMQIYNDTSRMIAFQIQTNFSDRPDLALTYYPSVIEFYWFVARTYNLLEETIQRTGTLPHKGMKQVYVDFKLALRKYASPRIVAQGKNGTAYGWDTVFYDDFLGGGDTDYENISVRCHVARSTTFTWKIKRFPEPVNLTEIYPLVFSRFQNNAEDRIFTTGMTLNALMTIWTTQEQNSKKVVWDKDTPEGMKTLVHNIVTWLYYESVGDKYQPWNVFFSGSYKGITTHPELYPINRLELFNGTKINSTGHAYRYIMGVEGFIPEKEYEYMMKHIRGKYHTPTVFPGYNNNKEFFPFWCSQAYTYVISLLGIAKYLASTMY